MPVTICTARWYLESNSTHSIMPANGDQGFRQGCLTRLTRDKWLLATRKCCWFKDFASTTLCLSYYRLYVNFNHWTSLCVCVHAGCTSSINSPSFTSLRSSKLPSLALCLSLSAPSACGVLPLVLPAPPQLPSLHSSFFFSYGSSCTIIFLKIQEFCYQSREIQLCIVRQLHILPHPFEWALKNVPKKRNVKEATHRWWWWAMDHVCLSEQ